MPFIESLPEIELRRFFLTSLDSFCGVSTSA
jgi:hypothetical protein